MICVILSKQIEQSTRKMKTLIVILLLVVSSQALIQCPPDACMTVRCAAVTETNCLGRISKNGGYCGCCDACIQHIAEGKSCFNFLLLGAPSTAECEPGTHCDSKSFTCVHGKSLAAPEPLSSCQSELQTYLGNQQNGVPLLGARKPVCDTNGNFSPKQCSGSQCYCVKKDGSKIDSYTANVWESSGQTCQCARDQAEYMATGLIGKLFYCTDDGSYQKYKCVGSVCFCSDSNGNQLGLQTAPIGQVQSLKC
ncbi:saxiphilin-like [Mytilus californianus]|uniref:saxiphilin-like n=1 Tax=Mytilus californianus TaxID=6549 RepID=UPI002247AA76|nr:saxiphilin-like [Mytilus californianus]